MLEQKCLSELKNTCKKDNVNFSRIRVAYIGEQNILSTLDQKFLTLPDEEQFKYAAMASQVFSGKPEERVLELDAVGADISPLEHLADVGLEDDEAVQAVFESIIETYYSIGRYAIILLEDSYDVMKVNSAGEELDESEETYHYVMCIICPVKLSEPGIECNETGIALRQRDWVIAKPDIAMIYPAFEYRSTDNDHIMYYTGKPKDIHTELMQDFLKTDAKYTKAMHTKMLDDFLTLKLANAHDLPTVETLIDGVHYKLEAYVGTEKIEEVVWKLLTSDILQEILTRLGVSESLVTKIKSQFETLNINQSRALLCLDKKRASKYKAYLSHKRSRDLLDRSKDALDAAGQLDLANEIETYMERTR